MPNLFIASGIFHPEAGGPATYLYEILPELQKLGFDVRVLTYGSPSESAYPYPVTKIPRRTLPLRLLNYGRAARPLLGWADLVYMHTLGLPLVGGQARRVVKIVGDQAWERAIRRGWIPPSEDVDVFQTKRYGLQVTFGQTARSREVRALDGVIVPSEYLKRMVVGWGVPPANVRVIYNALPPEKPSPPENPHPNPSPAAPLTGRGALPLLSPLVREGGGGEGRSKLRLQLHLPDAPLVLTAARLMPWKGVDHLMAALRGAPDVHLLVAGDGPMLPVLKAQAEAQGVAGRTYFLGNVKRDQMPLYMRAADYLALYSGYEGLSHTLLESLRAGTPVIASDKGGNPEVVQPGVNGLLVPYVNVEALTAALVEAFQPGKREALAANSQVGMERFDFRRMVEQTAAALREYEGIRAF